MFFFKEFDPLVKYIICLSKGHLNLFLFLHQRNNTTITKTMSTFYL